MAEEEEVMAVFPWKPVFTAVGDIISTGGRGEGRGRGRDLQKKKKKTGVVIGWLQLDAVVSAHSGPALDPEVETQFGGD